MERADRLVAKACAHLAVPQEVLEGPGRDREVAAARQVVCYLLHRAGYSAAQIGVRLGRDHSTVVDHHAGVLLGMREPLQERIAEAPGGPQAAQTPQHGACLTLTILEACHALGIGETMLRQMMRTGQLPTLNIGRWVLIPRQAVEQLVAEACIGRDGNSALSTMLR